MMRTKDNMTAFLIPSVPDQHYKADVSHEDRGPLRECLQELQKHFIFVTNKNGIHGLENISFSKHGLPPTCQQNCFEGLFSFFSTPLVSTLDRQLIQKAEYIYKLKEQKETKKNG